MSSGNRHQSKDPSRTELSTTTFTQKAAETQVALPDLTNSSHLPDASVMTSHESESNRSRKKSHHGSHLHGKGIAKPKAHPSSLHSTTDLRPQEHRTVYQKEKSSECQQTAGQPELSNASEKQQAANGRSIPLEDAESLHADQNVKSQQLSTQPHADTKSLSHDAKSSSSLALPELKVVQPAHGAVSLDKATKNSVPPKHCACRIRNVPEDPGRPTNVNHPGSSVHHHKPTKRQLGPTMSADHGVPHRVHSVDRDWTLADVSRKRSQGVDSNDSPQNEAAQPATTEQRVCTGQAEIYGEPTCSTSNGSVSRRSWYGHTDPTLSSFDPSAGGPWTKRQASAVDKTARDAIKPVLSSTPPARSHRSVVVETPGLALKSGDKSHVSAPLVAVVSLAATVVVGALLLIATQHIRGNRVSDSAVCDTRDCTEHARLILERLNRSANPCDDFHAYVCGTVDGDAPPTSADSLLKKTLAGRQARELVLELGDPAAVLSSQHASKAAYKAISALDACERRRSGQSATRFVEFMKARSLPWPAPPSTPPTLSDVLDILLDLIINWRVALWFDVKVSNAPDGRFMLEIGEPSPLALYRMEQLSGLDNRSYAEIVRSVASFLTEGNVTVDDAAVRHLQSDETTIREAILSDQDADEHDILRPAFSVFQNGPLAHSAFGDQWIALVNKHLSAGGTLVTRSTWVLVAQEERFRTLMGLLRGQPPTRLLDVVGWTLAFTYTWILEPPMDIIGGNRNAGPEADLATIVLCFLAVHESYGIVQAAPIFSDVFSAKERHRVEAVLDGVTRTAVDLLSSSVRISIDTKRRATVKLTTHMNLDIWPPVPFERLQILDLLYAQYPAESRTFFDAWMNSRKELRENYSNRYYGSLMLARCGRGRDTGGESCVAALFLESSIKCEVPLSASRYRWRHTRIQYLYSLNVLRLGLAAVFPPSYLRHGSQLTTYAGLGFQLARQLVRAIDERGRTLDYAGNSAAWWQQEANSSECQMSEAATPSDRRAVAELFALDVALAAMEESARSDKSPLRLKGLEELNEGQTFYVSYCSHFCSGDEPRARSLCNLAMNGSDFDRAFGCDVAALAVSGRRCLFV
ncbi:hypothetical protein HPB50_003924 [Hyalomma asiaticum]|uniref:Uncharacterized protein n=1 Tax=Hyalomma asiaticum TaxID=266040 RepID=A0ACB7T5W4_HYAAI|nr:hypothetical protein HPB50_003924 [Hyalomma asiaticum]